MRIGCGAGRASQADREPERAASTGLAVDADRPAHALDQPLADRQPQAGPAKLARRRAVGLGERLEEPCRGFRADADAGVGHFEAHRGVQSSGDRSTSCVRTTTSPCSVNLTALPTRFISTCRMRPASPSMPSGTLRVAQRRQLQALGVRLLGQQLDHVLDGFLHVDRG